MDVYSGDRAALATLPEEIVHQIFANFCTYCTLFREDIYGASEALKSLCRTSRWLRSVALPIFLHQPATSMLFTGGLLRRLQHYPDQGRHIWILKIPNRHDLERRWKFFTEAAQELLAPTGQELGAPHTEAGSPEFWGLSAGVLLNWADRVHTLEIDFVRHHGLSPSYRDLSFLSRGLGKLGDGTGFESIRCITIASLPSLQSMFEIPLILALLDAAVNMTHFRLWDISGCPSSLTFKLGGNAGPALRRLRIFELHHCVDKQEPARIEFASLCEILRLTEKLEVFRYVALSGYRSADQAPQLASPRQMVLGLLPVAKRLKHLAMNFATADRYGDQVQAADLSAFVKLETLELSLKALCRCEPQDHQDSIEPKVAPRIDEIIPPTVKRLCLYLGGEDCTGCQDCVLALARKVAQGGLPCLHSLELHHPSLLGSDLDELKSNLEHIVPILKSYQRAFRGTHVYLQFQGNFFVQLKADRPSEMAWMTVR